MTLLVGDEASADAAHYDEEKGSLGRAGQPLRDLIDDTQARRPNRASSTVWASASPGTSGRAAIAPALR